MRIRVCIGTEPKTEIARKVLEWSIRRHTAAEVDLEFHSLTTSTDSAALQGATGFSVQRWSIPERFAYQGRAIYLDADQLVFGDIRELWLADERHPDDRACAWCARRGATWLTSVMLIDCARARDSWPTLARIEELLAGPGKRRNYRHLMLGRYLKHPPAHLDAAWNHLDVYVPGKTRLLHYTDLYKQPWRDPRHPHSELWGEALESAIADGAVGRDEVERACERFEVSPNGKFLAGLHPHWRRRARLTPPVSGRVEEPPHVHLG